MNTGSGYSSTVALSCGSGAPASCVVSPASLVPSAESSAFTVTASSNLAQNYQFDVVAQGSDAVGLRHTAPVTFASVFDFSLTGVGFSQTVNAGQSASYGLQLSATGGTFTSEVDLACSGLPANSTCSFSPSYIPQGSSPTSVLFTITTSAAQARSDSPQLFFYAFCLPGLVLLSGGGRPPKIRRLGLMVLIVLLCALTACGGGLQGNSVVSTGGTPVPGTSPGRSLVTIVASSGSVSRQLQVELIVQ